MSTSKWRKITGGLRNLAVWLILLGIWEAAFRLIGWRDYIFPAPSHILTTFGFLARKDADLPFTFSNVIQSQLVTTILISLSRLAIGFAISLVFGVIVGVILWRSKIIDAAFGPFFLGIQTLPSVCWVPLAILTFGINETGMMFVLIMGSLFATALSLRDGLRTVPPIYHRAGTMLGASGLSYYTHVLLPASLPAFASSLRQGFSFAWRSLMGGELLLVTKSHGLGYLLEMGRNYSDVAQVVAVMVIMISIGMLVDRLGLAVLEARIHRRFGLIQAS